MILGSKLCGMQLCMPERVSQWLVSSCRMKLTSPPQPSLALQYRMRYEAYKAREAERAAALREQLAAVERGEREGCTCCCRTRHPA